MGSTNKPEGTVERPYTASDAFFEALWNEGIEYCFVNMGSDHPSLLEAMARGVANQNDPNNRFPKLITCPNEMVALSMADGYARHTGRPQCVIVHVDVGTLGLGAALHNAAVGRAPVLIFAGLSPCTIDGEHTGSRTEFSHWIQDVPGQMQIAAPYCRYVAEIKRGVNVPTMVRRALSFARSNPMGPVYLVSTRESMEEVVPRFEKDKRDMSDPAFNQNLVHSQLAVKGGLRDEDVESIAVTLSEATNPLVITGYLGRNWSSVAPLVKLADLVPNLRVIDTGGGDMCFPANHPAWLGLHFGEHPVIPEADVILVLDCDVPWINTRCKPKDSCKIFHVDLDHLKPLMNLFDLGVMTRQYPADTGTVLRQLVSWYENFGSKRTIASAEPRRTQYQALLSNIEKAGKPVKGSLVLPAGYLSRQLRDLCPTNTTWVVEAVTQTIALANQLQLTREGSWINCGGGGLGWSGGAALGVKLAMMKSGKDEFICHVVGDGTFLFSVPSSVAWISARYKIPVLTIVLVNGGWHAPRRSVTLVHPEGDAVRMMKADNDKAAAEVTASARGGGLTSADQIREHNHALSLPLSINDPTPRYGEIAHAASGYEIWCLPRGEVVTTPELLDKYLKEAIEVVKGGRSAVLDVQIG